jgi:glucan 1,4-alpha-maltotetraohydrolase
MKKWVYQGGEGYFWHDFNKNSRYGSDAQLQQTVAAMTRQHIKLVYDIVPNHMDKTHATTDLPVGQNLWRNDCASCDDGDPFMDGSADLNDGNPQIQAMFARELSNLHHNYGAAGFRFDFVRGYAPEHVNEWMKQTLDSGFCVGEMWKAPTEFPSTDPRHQQSWQEVLKGWSDTAYCTVFDFALKERMQNGTISDWRYGLNGNPPPRWREVAVTFIDNHDTGYSPGPYGGQHHWPLPGEKLKAGYAYILSSPGTPTVYWPHMYDSPLHDYLHLLIQNRKAAGIHADAEIQFPGGHSGLVALVKGTQQQLLLALNSDRKR